MSDHMRPSGIQEPLISHEARSSNTTGTIAEQDERPSGMIDQNDQDGSLGGRIPQNSGNTTLKFNHIFFGTPISDMGQGFTRNPDGRASILTTRTRNVSIRYNKHSFSWNCALRLCFVHCVVKG